MKNTKRRAEYRNKGREHWSAKDWATHEKRIALHTERIQAELKRLGHAADLEPIFDESEETL